MKRICLFAGYNYNNILSQYVVDYLRELSQYCDIYYLADGSLDTEKLSAIKPYVRGAWVENHKKYDFGSWSLLANKYVGWDKISEYDELIMANDSMFCVNSFKPVFERMDKRKELDMWGLAAADDVNTTEFSTFDKYLAKNSPNFYVGSYFIALRKKMFATQDFQNFINSVNVTTNRQYVAKLYEFELLKFAIRRNFKIGCFDNNVWRFSSVYMHDAFNMIKSGFPLLKVRIFVDNLGGHKWMRELAEETEQFCPVKYMEYVRQIQSERPCRIPPEKERNKKTVKKFVKRYMSCKLIDDAFHIKTYKKIFSLKNLHRFMKYILPPAAQDFFYALGHKPHSIRNTNKIRFSLRKPPKYNGFYPSNIKGYKKAQLQRAQNLASSQNMIIFFNIMREGISGGMLSIERFVRHSMQFAKENNFDVVVSGVPLENAVINNPFFDYQTPPVDFEYIVKYTHPQKLQLNIPECFVPYFVTGLTREMYTWLWSIPDLRINILNQNDDMMPCQHFIEELRTLCNNKLTITVAHKRYCTKEKAKQYKCPVYLLTPFLPEFIRTPVQNKRKIIVLSPDEHEYRPVLTDLIKKQLPDYSIRVVKNMTLDEYKRLISDAMFTITFGEGYDGYFLEPYLSDSIGFCVLNETFFPKQFKPFEATYESWTALINNIVDDIRKYESDPALYKEISEKGEKEIRKFTNNNQSNQDLAQFYARFLK